MFKRPTISELQLNPHEANMVMTIYCSLRTLTTILPHTTDSMNYF